MKNAYRHRPVTLSISEDVVQAAKTLQLNMSEAAEAGIQEAVRKAKAAAWLEENKSAIESYNRKIEKRGIAIPAAWARD